MNTVKATAKKIGMSEPFTWKAIYRGDLEHVKLGKAVRVTDEAIAEFIRKNTRVGKGA